MEITEETIVKSPEPIRNSQRRRRVLSMERMVFNERRPFTLEISPISLCNGEFIY